MLVQQHDKSWHFPFLIQCFLCKQPHLSVCAHMLPRVHARARAGCRRITCNGQFWRVAPECNGCKQKREMAGDMPIIHRWKMSDKKRPLKKTWRLFFSTSVLGTGSSWKRGPQTTGSCKRSDPDLNPIQVAVCWHRKQGEKAALHQGPALKDHLDIHKEKLNAAKEYSGLLKANPLEHINGEDSFSERTKSSWWRGFESHNFGWNSTTG